MVSLHGSSGVGHHSGFFSEHHSQNQDEENLIHPEVISTEEDFGFRPIRTVCITALLMVMLVVAELLVFLLPVYCRNEHCAIQEFSTLVYMQATIWCLLVIVEQFLRVEHQRLKQAGYMHFCRRTRFLRRVTLYVYSLGNAVLLTMQVIIQDFCYERHACHLLKSFNYIQFVLTAENLVSITFVITYFVITLNLCMKRPPPDVVQDELLSSFSQIRIPTSEIGYRDNSPVDVIERQADVIRYLKQHSSMLGKKLIEITADLNSRA